MSLSLFQAAHPNYPTNFVPGVDVSGYQTPEQLDQALSWAKWCIIKTTEGLTFFETYSIPQTAIAKQHGAPYGYYHFAQPKFGNPEGEAQHFVSSVNSIGGFGAIDPVLDLEAGEGDLSDYVLRFRAEVQRLTGRDIILYTGPGFIQSHLTSPRLADIRLWLAHYAKPGADAWVPAPFKNWLMWQWTSDSALGSLDLNVARPDFLAGGFGVAALSPAQLEEQKNMALITDGHLKIIEALNPFAALDGKKKSAYEVIEAIVYGSEDRQSKMIQTLFTSLGSEIAKAVADKAIAAGAPGNVDPKALAEQVLQAMSDLLEVKAEPKPAA